MQSVSPLRTASRPRGVALVIVLAFVVLLTGVVLAFFSRAISERQISNGSAGEVRADLFAQGAADSIIADLRQEIVAGSKITTPSGIAVYLPKAPTTAVPALVLGTATNNGGLNNLVKRSARNQPFFPTGNANYDPAYPPSNRAAVVSSGPDDDDNPPSGGYASLNGRYVSAKRWNKPLLLAKKNLDKEAVDPTLDFKSPDWVLVARDGSNPTAWNANMVTTNNTFTSVVGRYAYNIYDEGGILDANVAGYPSPLNQSPNRASHKNALAFADLRELRDASGNSFLTDAQIDSLVGWRNYASGQATGSFPALTFAAPADPFYKFVAGNMRGFLTMGNTSLTGNKQSDRMFATRQELIKLLLQGVASVDPTTGAATTDSATLSQNRIKLQNALQYLGTFSRGLDQPSFIRTQSVDSTDSFGYDVAAPKLLASNAGGNNAQGLDAAINPSFLAVRVKTAKAGGRSDGSDLVVGEPLVKRRFALSRLAWLTFAGPICADGSNYNSATGVDTIVKALKDKYGFTDTFLKQGTTENIQKYFGLTWDKDPTDTTGVRKCWLYNQHNKGGSTNKFITKLSYASDGMDVLHAGREADFFELLKAAVNVGSLGKVGTVSLSDTNASKLLPSQLSQYSDDCRVDDAIIQMGANIIDQFDLDGYSTQIYFDDGTAAAGGKVFHGVENLPYLSALKHALVKVKQANPTLIGTGNSATITNSGVGALLQCPELWNPHDYNTATASQIDQTAGVVGPTKFRIYAQSGLAGVNDQVQLVGILRDKNGDNSNIGHHQTDANVTRSPGYQSLYGFAYASPESRALNADNTELDFTVSRDPAGLVRFREPTILCLLTSSSGYVDGSPAPGKLGTIGATNSFFSGNGLRSDVTSGISGALPTQNQGYVGFYLGAVPLLWYDNINGTNTVPYWLGNVAPKIPAEMHYYLQYQDPLNPAGWVTYDEKYRTLGGSGQYSENSSLSGGGANSPNTDGWQSFFYPRITGKTVVWDCAYAAMDPRSVRFGLMKLVAGKADQPWWTYPPYQPSATGTMSTRSGGTMNSVSFTQGWIEATKGIGLAVRNGNNDGSPMYCAVGVFPTTMGWNAGSPVSALTGARYVSYDNSTGNFGATTGSHVFHPGLMSQNNPFARRNNRVMGDSSDPVAMDNAFLPPQASNAGQFYADADAVIRRASAGLVPYTVGTGPTATSDMGLPAAPANTSGTTRTTQSDSRPVVLNRPFRTVGELGYTFAGTPWKNINFNMPESPDAALLDVFCINPSDDAGGLTAGRVNLNTRQVPVLQAVLAGACKNEWNPADAVNGALAGGTSGVANRIAAALVKRTTNGPTAGLNAGKPQPLANVSDLVGKWVSYVPASDANGISGNATSADPPNTPLFNPRSYDGFSADLIDNRYTAAGDGVLMGNPAAVPPSSADANSTIGRFANASVRALSGVGQTRVWNLLIDVVAQTGRYPQAAVNATTPLAAFNVEGEQRYWVHIAIDRFTGQVLDKQIEVVKE